VGVTVITVSGEVIQGGKMASVEVMVVKGGPVGEMADFRPASGGEGRSYRMGLLGEREAGDGGEFEKALGRMCAECMN